MSTDYTLAAPAAKKAIYLDHSGRCFMGPADPENVTEQEIIAAAAEMMGVGSWSEDGEAPAYPHYAIALLRWYLQCLTDGVTGPFVLMDDSHDEGPLSDDQLRYPFDHPKFPGWLPDWTVEE